MLPVLGPAMWLFIRRSCDTSTASPWSIRVGKRDQACLWYSGVHINFPFLGVFLGYTDLDGPRNRTSGIDEWTDRDPALGSHVAVTGEMKEGVYSV